MAPIMMYLRTTLRSTRLATLGLVVLVGVAGGVVLSAAAGARRTETAYPRMLDSSIAADVLISPEVTGTSGFYAAVGKLPQVDVSAPSAACLAFALPGDTPEDSMFPGVAAMDARAYHDIERPKVLAGRVPRPDRADEAFANERLARILQLTPGERIDLAALPSEPEAAAGRSPIERLTIVGIGLFPGEVVPTTQLDAFPTLYLTPAYLARHPEQPGCEGFVARLRPGADVERFRVAVNDIARAHEETGGGVFFQNQRLRNAKVVRAIRPQAVALWLFALLTAATFLVVIGQILARHGALAATSHPALRALGMTRRQMFAASMLRMAIVCAAGGILAVAVAIVSSPLMPIGPARLAEPAPGFSVNTGLLLTGFAGIIVLLLGITVLPLWRSARGYGEPAGSRSRLAGSVLETRLPAPARIGIVMAVDPGRGRTAVPVRSALAGAMVAVAAGATAVIFGANLDRLVRTPALYGWRWDAVMDTGFGLVPKTDVARIAADPSVEALAGGHYGNGNVTVNGLAVPAVGLDQVKGETYVRLISGRAPRTSDEAVLGVKVAKRIGAQIGSTVRVGTPSERNMRVVGIAVFPALGHGSFEPTGLGEGIALTAEMLAAPFQGPVPEAQDAYTFAAVRFVPGTDVEAATRRLQSSLDQFEACRDQLCEVQRAPRTPADISNYARVRSTPLVLAGAFAILAAATLGHTLVTAVNRRRRDLAVLKTIGFVRRQVSAAVAWQAATVAVAALVVGIPAGVVAGRRVWLTFAEQLGVPFEPRVPLAPVLLAIPASIVVANVIAALPARSAANTRPAMILRTE